MHMSFKVLLPVIMMLAVNVTVYAQPPKGVARPTTTYGAGATLAGAVAASKLPALLSKDTSRMAVKIIAKVVDVCPKKGCWMQLQVDDSTTAFVKMKDYAFFVPLDIKGKVIVLDGEAYQHVTSVAELRHYAEDAHKSQQEIDAITAPRREIRYTANGIVVVE
jgi:DNA-directed RNA polymerase subunit F